MRIIDVLKWASEYLSKKHVEYPQKVAEILLEATMDIDKIKFYLYPDTKVETHKFDLFKSFVQRRTNFEPVQYITGWTEFFGTKFRVNKDVFIPRPETEILVEEIIKEKCEFGLFQDILDIGTGSGNIAVSLAKIFSDSLIEAIDISKLALNLAMDNAKINNVEDKINFSENSIFEDGIKNKFDLIISNPPYIKKTEIENLPKEIKYYEPVEALDGGTDGLDFYRIIIKKAKYYLKKYGILALECGIYQSKEIIGLIQDSGFLNLKRVVKDLSGIDRVIVAKNIG